MKSYSTDYNKGCNDEIIVLPIITKFFNRDIKKTENRYSKFDFEDNEFKYEMKSRNNKYNTFPTTLIPADKLVCKNIIFLFKFFDGLYYIEYDEDTFKNFEKSQYCRNKRYGYNDKPKDYIFIPIECLKKIE
jgi:hypothetical protein